MDNLSKMLRSQILFQLMVQDIEQKYDESQGILGAWEKLTTMQQGYICNHIILSINNTLNQSYEIEKINEVLRTLEEDNKEIENRK